MSTTVTYKGSTLTTVDNQTRTLKTAGKYMEGDVILTDVTEGGGTSWQTCMTAAYRSIQVVQITSRYRHTLPAFQSGQTYRVTWGQTQYLCTTVAVAGGATYDGYTIGNLSIAGAGADTGDLLLFIVILRQN